MRIDLGVCAGLVCKSLAEKRLARLQHRTMPGFVQGAVLAGLRRAASFFPSSALAASWSTWLGKHLDLFAARKEARDAFFGCSG